MSVPEKDRQKKERETLQEKDYIYERKQKDPFPLWLWITILVGIIALLWIGGSRLVQQVEQKVETSPFLRVTNRKMSLFLWQNTEHMRSHTKRKTGYMPGFYSDRRVTPKVETADRFVSAPPEVIFLYQTWERLLSQYVFPRPISTPEFQEFLRDDEQWQPENWSEAPEEYKYLVQELNILEIENLQTLPEETLPKEVRNAFIGWKNYFREGSRINRQVITVEGIRKFLEEYPNYSRNYWRNIYPNYLESLLNKNVDPTTTVPDHELTSFLRAAYYNYTH
ncbi:MAG: hypothetical protein K940chlam7_01121 [Chlamydiae bacterium]|nr:hypothetical protein [Chlamydiota bacterium]